MDVKYQIFVSSTFVDLQEERRRVIEMILNMGHIPIGMEAFQASDSTQWEYITRRIDESDYYVVIIAERYGSMESGKSYTQMEYEYAVSKEIPVAAFLLDDEVRKTWPLDRAETDKRPQIETFRDIAKKKLVKAWRNPDDLGGKVALALNELFKDKPRLGWVRAHNVASTQVVEEIARLSEEKRVLTERLAAFTRSGELTIPNDVVYRATQMQMVFMNGFFEEYDVEDETPSLLDVFLYTASKLAVGCQTFDVLEVWRNHLQPVGDDNEAAERVLAEFTANNLVEVRMTLYGNIQKKVFFLTPYGKDFAMYATKWLVDLHTQSLPPTDE
ncbi:DUF4062 domain-containing protein [Agrobacterium tumefaciens]|uniref:DUF4062 domain-containing protein n=1 Tax=Agrobacterium tumefaciens TaxID=358 RepID=UPI000472287F